MKRKQFLAAMGTAVAAGFVPLKLAAAPGFKSKRAVTECTYEVGALPEVVFPLLCPVREYEWIDTWKCDLVYTESGVAEDNCIFNTDFAPVGPMTWAATRYEPPTRIEYLAVAPGRLVMRLVITLERNGAGTRMHWKRTYTGLSGEGNGLVGSFTVAMEHDLGRKLDHFVKTGTMAP